MKAVIMAGGEGTRLRPLTCELPKPMVRIMNAPLLEHCIRLLKKHGIEDIAVTCGYMGGKIKEYFGSGAALGVRLSYFSEDIPLGTAGGLRNAAEFIDGDFLCISGGILTDTNLKSVIDFHRSRGGAASLALVKAPSAPDYGAVITDASGRVLRFSELPDWHAAASAYISAEIYVLSPEILSLIPPDTGSDLRRDILPLLLDGGRGIYAVKCESFWADICDASAYRKCHSDILDNKLSVSLPRQTEEGIRIEDGAVIEKGAVLRPPIYIGSGSKICRGARIEPYSVIGRGVTVSGGAGVKRSVVLDGAKIEENAQLRGCVADAETIFRRGSAVYEQAVIGRGSIVGENCAVKPSVKIWPGKELPADTVQKRNLIWGDCVSSRIWTRTGICGELGRDITPEVFTRLGAAAGSICENERLAVSDYGSPASAMLKSAFVGGALSTGVRLYDFGEQPLPVSRSGVRFHGMKAGVSVNVYSSGGTDYGEARIITSGGADPDAELIAALRSRFEREDFVRGGAETVNEAEYLFEYKLFYLKNLINSTKKQSLGYKLILGCGSPWAERLLKSAGNDLNCHIEAYMTASAPMISEKVISGGADLGAVIDPSCQELTLINSAGTVIDRDSYTLLSAMIVMRTYKNARIYVPSSAPSGVEQLAERYGAAVIRTRSSPPELMHELTKTGSDMLRDQFIYAFDAVGALIKLLDFMKTENASLAELTACLPETHMVHTGVDCGEGTAAFERLLELHPDRESDLTDGLKLTFDRGWVLILPAEAGSALSIVSQGSTEEYARELADMCIDEIASV